MESGEQSNLVAAAGTNAYTPKALLTGPEPRIWDRMVPRSTPLLTKQSKPYLWMAFGTRRSLADWPWLIHRLFVVCNMITPLVLRLCLVESLWSLRAHVFEREVVRGTILVRNGLTRSSTTE